MIRVTVSPERRGRESQVEQVDFDHFGDLRFAFSALDLVARQFISETSRISGEFWQQYYSSGMGFTALRQRQLDLAAHEAQSKARYEQLDSYAALADKLCGLDLSGAIMEDGPSKLQLTGDEAVLAYETLMEGIGLLATEEGQVDLMLEGIQYQTTGVTA